MKPKFEVGKRYRNDFGTIYIGDIEGCHVRFTQNGITYSTAQIAELVRAGFRPLEESSEERQITSPQATDSVGEDYWREAYQDAVDRYEKAKAALTEAREANLKLAVDASTRVGAAEAEYRGALKGIDYWQERAQKAEAALERVRAWREDYCYGGSKMDASLAEALAGPPAPPAKKEPRTFWVCPSYCGLVQCDMDVTGAFRVTEVVDEE